MDAWLISRVLPQKHITINVATWIPFYQYKILQSQLMGIPGVRIGIIGFDPLI